MNIKDSFHHMLRHARNYTEGVLKELPEPTHWIQRACPGGNHAFWIVGHLAYAENFFAMMVRPELALPLDGYDKLFGRGSLPIDDVAAYPDRDDLLQVLRDRRSALIQALEGCSDADFEKKASEKAPPFMRTIAEIFQGAVWHESLHGGQLSIIHRQLGNAPLGGRPAA